MQKRHLVLNICYLALASLSIHSQTGTANPTLRAPASFDVGSAMSALFGNFDSKTESSHYDIPQTTLLNLEGSQFQIGDEIVVQPLWAARAREDGTNKVVLLTFAVPKGSYGHVGTDLNNFDCHACTPLIGAAIFVRQGDRWEVESSRAVVSRGGGFGSPPTDIRIIQIGPRRFGIEIAHSDTGGGETTTSKLIMVAWKGKMNEALRFIASDNDGGECGLEDSGLPCYSNRKRMSLVTGGNHDYFDVLLTLSGTDLTEGKSVGRRAVHGFERLSFQDGFYKRMQRNGDKTSVEVTIDSRP